MRDVIREKLADAVTSELPQLTRRDVRLPRVPRKVQSIIGMRRSGKTCLGLERLIARDALTS